MGPLPRMRTKPPKEPETHTSPKAQPGSEAAELSLPVRSAIDVVGNELARQTLRRLGPLSVSGNGLIMLLEAEPRDADAIIKAIKLCPLLSARLLAVINSAAYGMAKQINNIERAVALLGPRKARMVAMAYGLRVLTEDTQLPRDLVDLYWCNSLRKACAARKICELHAPDHADAAYCSGLIQDIGIPMFLAVDLDYYSHHIVAMAHRMPWCGHETQRFGFDHAALGHELLRHWSAADHLKQTILMHHRPPMDLEFNEDSMLSLAGFLASLLPHLDEEPSAQNIQWIQAIHARFLAGNSASPDAFFQEINKEVGRMQAIDIPFYDHDRLIRSLSRQVTSSAIGVTAKLCYLEHRIRRQREGIADLKFQAFTDGLTKVLNRRGFTQLGERRIQQAAERHTGVCCMLGDLDDFKLVNDNYGHEVGDLVLRGLAKLLRRHLSENDLIARIGGDEFAILVSDLTEEDAENLCQRVVSSIKGKLLRVKPEIQIRLRFSLGAVYSTQDLHACSIDQLLKYADEAMYHRKRYGKDGLTFVVRPAETADEAATQDAVARPQAAPTQGVSANPALAEREAVARRRPRELPGHIGAPLSP